MNVRRLIVSLCLATLLGASALAAPPPRAKKKDLSFKLNVHRVTLDNGMVWLLVPRNKVPIFSGYIQVKCGGVDEVPGIS